MVRGAVERNLFKEWNSTAAAPFVASQLAGADRRRKELAEVSNAPLARDGLIEDESVHPSRGTSSEVAGMRRAFMLTTYRLDDVRVNKGQRGDRKRTKTGRPHKTSNELFTFFVLPGINTKADTWCLPKPKSAVFIVKELPFASISLPFI